MYLLIKPYENSSYGFPKGHLEDGEDDFTAAKREVKEETGLIPKKFIDEFSEEVHYVFGKDKDTTVKKTVTYFLAQVSETKIQLSEEHICYIWVDYKKAKQLLKYHNLRKILDKAEKKLTE